MNPLTREIRVLLSSINQFIQKMPKAKIQKTQYSIKEALNIPNPDSEESLRKVLKNLQYKYNFLKIAYPSLTPEVDKDKKTIPEEEFNSLQLKFDYNLYWNNMLDNTDPSKNITNNQENKEKTQSQEQEEEEEKSSVNKNQTGKYIMKDGKLVKGEAERRNLVDFSNWVAANVDPEDLKKHRELLDRQHFRGPVWEGKKIPSSILDEKNPLFNMDTEGEINPNIAKPKKEEFELVKR